MTHTRQVIVDENGVQYPTLLAAATAHGIEPGGRSYRHLKATGKVVLGGHTFSIAEVDEDGEVLADGDAPRVLVVEDPLAKRLRARYSENELEAIANGEGIERTKIHFPEIRLTGVHHRFVVISDTHVGSIYSPDEWHEVVEDYVNAHPDVEAVLHCGDLVEGLKISRAGTQMYELSEVGFEAQKKKAVELLAKYNVPVYIISGNHDAYYKEFAGANIVHAVAEELDHVYHIGDDEGDIDIDGVKLRLFHGADGNSYALSYRLQKIVEAITGGTKPNILLAGHVHKFCYIFERNVHAISVPCMQMQTAFMRGKKLAAHTGFLDLQFDALDGKVCNLSVTLFPFYG